MSSHGIFRVPEPFNEPVLGYEPGSPERAALRQRLDELSGQRLEIPLVIGGEEVQTGDTFEAVMPHKRNHVLADVHKGGTAEVHRAIAAAADAWEDWSRTPWEDRAAVILRAAELLAGPWRQTLNAATMLGQSKTAHRAEIDSACELLDFWRFNVQYMTRIYEEQPISSPGVWNRLEYRPLEGFVFAVTPFNFTAIAGNLPTSAALMGNTVVWKPASTAAVSAHFLMKLWEEAGLPPGVINLVYGSGAAVGDPALVREQVADEIGEMKMGDVADFSNFVGAVIDASSFATQKDAIEEAKGGDGKASIVAGGGYDDSEGWFVQPTVIETSDPDFRTMKEELFGPVVTAFVYDDSRYEDTLDLVDQGTSYGLTGAVFARDLQAVETARDRLRYAAGNFYVNDKPTGAVVGQQPFGGARASGTNDKAGSMWNLIRWVSPRTIKELFVPPTDYRYPYMGEELDAGR